MRKRQPRPLFRRPAKPKPFKLPSPKHLRPSKPIKGAPELPFEESLLSINPERNRGWV